MKKSIHILHLTHDATDTDLVQANLMEVEIACRITHVQTPDEFHAALQKRRYDIILAEFRMPGYDGMAALRSVRKQCPDAPFIFFSNTTDAESAIEGLTQGAANFVLKKNAASLSSAIKRALDEPEHHREHLQMEKDLHRQSALLRCLIDSVSDLIFIKDRNGVYQGCNKASEIFIGVPEYEQIGKTDFDFFAREKAEEIRALDRQVIASGKPFRIEEWVTCRDGSKLLMDTVKTPCFGPDGETLGMVGIGRDITERYQAEHERLANLYFFENMDKINRAVQGTNDLEQMMRHVLDVVLSIFDCERVYLLYPCDPEATAWSVPMERSKPGHAGSVYTRGLAVPMEPSMAEMLRFLVDADGPLTFGPGTRHPLPTHVSQRYGFQSMITTALFPKVGKPWQFGIHQCTYARVWTPEEEMLVQGIGRRLSDALTGLLTLRDLRNNEEFLNNIVEHIPNEVFVKEAQTLTFVKLNKAGEQFTGYSREELIGKSVYDLFPKPLADAFTARDRKALDLKELVDIPEEVVLSRDREELTLHTQLIPILDDTGNPQFLLGISENITERKRSEASIRKLSQAIAQSPVSIVITDAEGTIEFVNDKFTQVTGYPAAEALGQNPRILKSGETPDEEYRRLWRTIKSGGVWQGEFHNRKKTGELFWELATIAPIRNADNAITHYVAVKEDISEHKKLEGQLRQAQKMDAVGQLAGGIAHDFNNMLGVIIGYCELSLLQIDPAHPLFAALQEIKKAADHSANLTRQLLAFARKQTIAPKVLNLNEVIPDMLKMLQRLISEDIDFVWLPGAHIWPINMDPSQIDQILANLCVNARDAISGSGRITIETQTATLDEAYCTNHLGFSPGDFVVLTVSDNGCGMDRETLNKIFEPFYTTKERGKGTGLGLSTVYGIVKQNDGFINVYSEPNHGTSFKTYLPRHVIETDPAQKEISSDQPVGGKETILLVEDEPAMLDLTQLMLEGLGYRVLAAATPREAIRMARKHECRIDLLMTDVIMPEMNGKDLSEAIIAILPGIKILFMSGYTTNVIADHGILTKGIHYIQKPFSIQSVSARVRDVIDKGGDDGVTVTF
jgi:PAS domain S-box-containing protein